MTSLSEEIVNLLVSMRLKRAPSGIEGARQGVFGLLGAHDENLSKKPETDFRINTDLCRRLRDSGFIVETNPDGQAYLYAHGIVVHSNASIDGAEKRLRSKVSAFKEFLLARGFAKEADDVRVHLKGFNLRNLDDLRESVGRHASGLKKAIKSHVDSLKGMHSVVIRIRLRHDTREVVERAFKSWKRSSFLTRSSGTGGTDVLLQRAYKSGVLTSTVRINKPGPNLYRRDTPGQLFLPNSRRKGRR